MITVNIRKQGGAAIITIPSDVLRMLNLEVGSTLQLELASGSFTARPIAAQAKRKRYALSELLRGTAPSDMDALNAETSWAREGEPVGRELA